MKVLAARKFVGSVLGFSALMLLGAQSALANPTDRFDIKITSDLKEAIQGQRARVSATATLTQNYGQGVRWYYSCWFGGKRFESGANVVLDKGDSVSCSYTTPPLMPDSSELSNLFRMNVFKMEPSGQSQFYNRGELKIIVHRDAVKPVVFTKRFPLFQSQSDCHALS